MESWNYVCEEGKGFMSDESTSDKNVLMGWELGFSEIERKPWIVEEHESSSKFSSSGSVVESSDLELLGGGLPPSKKVKMGVNSLIPYCQVYGCKKDLACFKDYYRRHKVCEVHSKTVKVIVNGVEQRFCQQCSRFHLLGEFDNGKRSCRKRLAGHNERRRKPHPGRNGRLLQSYNGSKIQWNSLSLSSVPFIFQDVASSCNTHELKYNPSNWIKHRKVEDGSGYDPQPEISPHLFDKDCQAYPMTAKYLYEHDQGTVNSVSGLLFQNISTGREDFCRDYSTPSVQGLSTTSGQARSLLSFQSPRIPFGQPTNVISCGKIYSVDTNSIERNQLITDDHVDFTEGFLPELEMMNAKEHGSCDDARFTMDLLQLSSQLQQVEQPRQSPQVKQEIGTFYGLRMT